jgi:predicted kinase
MKVTILRGISGSGKTTLAEGRKKMADGEVHILSADDFMVRFGEYVWDASMLQEAHMTCLRDFTAYVWRNNKQAPAPGCLIVDNTNTQMIEVTPYYRLAEAFGLEVKVITLLCDPQVAWMRSMHVADAHVILNQHRKLMNDPTPPFFKRELLWVDDRSNTCT